MAMVERYRFVVFDRLLRHGALAAVIACGCGDDSGPQPFADANDDRDAGGGDDAGTEFPTEPGISLANLWGTPIDFCFRAPGAVDFTGPVFDEQGGVPDRAVSVRYAVEPESFVILVNAGAGCASTPIFTGGSVTTDATPAITLVVRGGTIQDARITFFRPADHESGKDNVYYGRQGRDATFIPSGGAAITLDDAAPTALDANVTGQLSLENGNDTVTRAMTTSAGVLLLLDAPLPQTTPLLCDLLAPTTGHLHRCDDNVRAP